MARFTVTFLLIAILWGTCPTDGQGRRFRVVTFNAQCLMAPGSRSTPMARFRWDAARKNHLEQVASIVETLDPDVFNLVEVTSAKAVDAVVEILHQKGLIEFQGYHVESMDKFSGFDVAVISKFAPDRVNDSQIRCIHSSGDDSTWTEEFTYPGDRGITRESTTTLRRNALYFISAHGYKFGFLGLHLKSNPSDPYANGRRTAESLISQKIIRQEIVARSYLPIVLGDINDYDPDVPDRDPTRSTVTRVLDYLKDYDPDRPGAELVNTTAEIMRQSDRYSSHWDRNENGAADSEDVMTMIDHILVPRQLASALHRVFVSRCHDLDVSDHWPVVVELDLPDLGDAK